MKKRVSFFLLALLAVMPATLSAKVEIKPSFTVREEYNDNIFLTQTNREDAFITTFSPAISLKYKPLRYLDLSLDYGMNFRLYSRHNELNDTSLSETQAVKFKTQIKPLNNFFIDVSDTYQRVPIDVRRQVALDNVFVNMTDSNIFSISPYMQIPLTSSITTTFGYGYSNTWYKAGEAIDSEGHSAFATINKQFPSGLNIALKYNYFAYRPDNTGDYNRQQGSVLARYQAGRDMTVWGEVGHSYLNFKNGPDADEGTWNVGTSYNMAILGGTSIAAAYSVSLSESQILQSTLLYGLYLIYDEKTGNLVGYSPFVYEKSSTTTGVTKIKRLDLSVSSGKKLKVNVKPYYFVEDELMTSRKDRAIGVSANISKALTQKLDASLNGVWERQKFLPADEKSRRYSLGSSINYKAARRITTTAGYTYNTKNSTVSTNDFHNNIVYLQGRMDF